MAKGSFPTSSTSPWFSRLFKAVVILTLASYALFKLSKTVVGGDLGPFQYPPSCHFGAPEGTKQYAGEHIAWTPCGSVGDRPLECSTIDVPMDQFDLESSAGKTFSIPLIRLRARDGAKNLVLNPGGPGGSGAEFLHRRGEQLSTIVGDGFHLLSFDPRGINASRPMASCYPDATARRRLSTPPGYRVIEDSPNEYALAQNTVQACRETMGEHGEYINTPQTAADMNSILDAVGQDNMIYWGFSYGTLLGQTYATMYPDRSLRVIIDGVVNQYDWYDAPFDKEAFTDTDDVLDGFFDECIKAGHDCALSSLASSTTELSAKVLSMAHELAEQPLGVYVNSTLYGTLTFEKIMYAGIFPALYKPTQLWYGLAENLARLLNGNATDALLAYGLDDDIWGMEGEALWFVMLNDGTSGPKYWPQDRRTLLSQLIPVMNESLFAPTENRDYYLKQQWLVPRTHTYTPQVGVKTAHPLLILSQHYDPITPLISARSAKASFVDSEIVEVMGYGHSSVAAPSICTVKWIRAFLYDGDLPDQHTQCDVDGPYFVRPVEEGRTQAFREFEDPAQQRIHEAQVALAMDPDWPRW